ncbi:hypothetical protein KP509_33G066900 [Ceratopteris richardii]|uniref:Secreted protein n=1 Tax=Ceratopteris richardii TaxID=49495 RepID=A0A8T2QRS2_CERRI|nr:hypothetical protein KP509_33G066800 [Ceratopteris richardii]KAH7286280.1 hypothetical protein KP509_33G066900 [Ceratopteris richardii]
MNARLVVPFNHFFLIVLCDSECEILQVYGCQKSKQIFCHINPLELTAALFYMSNTFRFSRHFDCSIYLRKPEQRCIQGTKEGGTGGP